MSPIHRAERARGAVADVSHRAGEQLAARWQGARAVESAAEIIADPSIDAVWICTPTAMHREVCMAAARAGKHIFCEKPLAMTSAQAPRWTPRSNRGRDESGRSRAALLAGLHRDQSDVRGVDAGRLLSVAMRDDQDFPTRGAHASAWRNDPSLTAGGTLIEHSVHDFDLLTWMFGPIASLYCRINNLNGAAGVEDFGATQMEFARGFHGQLTSVWHRMMGRSSNRRLEVFAENSLLRPTSIRSGQSSFSAAPARTRRRFRQHEVMARFTEIILRERPYLAPIKDRFAIPYAAEDATFIAALKGVCAPDPEFSAGVAAQRIVEAAYESARTGSTVKSKA